VWARQCRSIGSWLCRRGLQVGRSRDPNRPTDTADVFGEIVPVGRDTWLHGKDRTNDCEELIRFYFDPSNPDEDKMNPRGKMPDPIYYHLDALHSPSDETIGRSPWCPLRHCMNRTTRPSIRGDRRVVTDSQACARNSGSGKPMGIHRLASNPRTGATAWDHRCAQTD